MKRLLAVVIVTVVLMAASAALAATDTATLNVSATVVANCRIISTSAINFGNYDPTDTNPLDAAGSFDFRCTKGTSYDLYITPATGSRTMTDGTDTLNFELYTDAGRVSAWPSALPGMAGVAASNAPDTANVYGRIASGQDVGAGGYNGSVTVTIEY